MVDQDIKIKIKEVIEATILSIIQEQSEKIEKLEKIVEQQQERIEHLESKILTQGQHSSHKSLQHNTSNSNQHQVNSEQKPDSSAIKSQLKKLEQDKGSEQKQRPASKSKTINVQPQKSTAGHISNRQQIGIGETKQVQAKDAIKALPEPKKLKPSTNETSKTQFNSSQPIKPLGQSKHQASTKDLGMKKSPSQANQLTVNSEQLVKASQSPKNGTKSTFFPKPDEGQILKSPEKLKNDEENQFIHQIQSEQKEKDAQESVISSQQSEIHEIVDTLQNQLEQTTITAIPDEGQLIQIDFKTMTIDSFDIIEMNFVNDLLSQQEIPDSIKLVVFTFLLIVEENNKYNFEESNFWEKASKFLQENEKVFPQFLTSVLQKKFQQTQLDQISNLIKTNPDLIDPDKYEDIDALTCSLAYFIKDFYVGLQKMS